MLLLLLSTDLHSYTLLFAPTGNSWWVSAMKWSGRAKYNSTGWIPFTVAGTEKGSARVAEPLSFLKVSGKHIAMSMYARNNDEVQCPVPEHKLDPFITSCIPLAGAGSLYHELNPFSRSWIPVARGGSLKHPLDARR